MEKPTVYLDTTIISAYWYDGTDLPSFARRLKTREWWDHESEHFTVWASGVTEKELRAGEFRRQDDCVNSVRRLRYLPTTRACQNLKDRLLHEGIVPVTKPLDALHMAIATAHGMDYLLTWNYAHLANPVAQRQLEVLCDAHELRAPLLVSPESIPSVRMGGIIRRRERP